MFSFVNMNNMLTEGEGITLDVILDKIDDCLRSGLENESIRWCVEGLKKTKDATIKRKLENIMVSLL